ncbi:hypothetical protein [Planctomycetes bacterium K23_9]|uniref:Lipoprotein n=1 Tax=Stieleria marina TaxID=1930275 RepID=A0A517P2B0_9BACT|nr:hypothetical protein K239x_55340 [Planctomycetes bacterium K23_9]
MKKILIAFAAFFCLGGISLVGCLVLASRMTSDAHKDFFDQVATGDANLVLSKCTPGLQDEIDAPVLSAWLTQFNKELGAFESTSNFNYNIQSNNGVTTTQVGGTANFASGKADVELKYIGDLLNGFDVKSPALEGDWFTGPEDSTLYQDRAKEFLRAFAGGKTSEAYAMMHEALQSEIDEAAAAKMGQSVAELVGEVNDIEVTGTEFTNTDGDKLIVSTIVSGESKKLDATVTYQFIGLKGHLLAFNFSSPAEEKTEAAEEQTPAAESKEEAVATE